MNINDLFVFKSLSFKLNVSDEPLLNMLDQGIQILSNLEKNVGTGSDSFKRAAEALRLGIEKGIPLNQLLDSKIKLRAYSVGIAEKNIRAAGISQKDLDKIDQLTSKPTSQLLSHLLTWYATDYNKLENYESLQLWLKKHIQKDSVQFEKWLLLLERNAPKVLVKYAVDRSCSLKEALNDAQLLEIQGGELFSQAQNIYYLETLKKLKANQDSPIFQEIIRKEVYESPYEQGIPLGIKVLEILIDTMPENGELESVWEEVINAIAEDPRLAETAPMYRKWWQPLGNERIEKAQAWFSKMDLKLFLKVIEDHAREKDDRVQLRMFPARKIFLEGLFNAGFVQSSRLYLSRDSDVYVKKHLNKKELPKYSMVSTNDKSIIYLKLLHHDKTVHLIEGSHECYMWLHPRLPERNIISNYSKIKPSYTELTSGLKIDGSVNIIHSPKSWQANAIVTLHEMGIPIYPEDVIPKAELHKFNQQHGHKL